MRPILTVLLVAAFLLTFAATAKGQSISTEKVVLCLKDGNLETAIKSIEQQSPFRFFYRDAEIKPLAHLNLTEQARTIEETLALLLDNTSLSFRQIDDHILLERNNEQGPVNITGRVLNGSNKEPVTDASVFLSNATIGGKTAGDGTFILHNVKPGKYNLVISSIGFETVNEALDVDNNNIILPDIMVSAKTIVLNEVRVHPKTDQNPERNYYMFKEEFLGTSYLAKACKILNPEVLDIYYDDVANTLSASSSDFLEIENDALGYKIKYLLTNFTLDNRLSAKFRLDYEGSVLFEEMKGTTSQEKHWKKRRQEVYDGSMMHFLRSSLNNTIDQQGFRALRLARYANPERPHDSLIEAKIQFYKKLEGAGQRDSLSFWTKKSKLPKMVEKLTSLPLSKKAMIKPTNQPGLFALGFGRGKDGLFISYNKNHKFFTDWKPEYLNDNSNTENTLVDFDSLYVFFDRNGVAVNPNTLELTGVWGKKRVAELLPVDYEAPKTIDTPIEKIAQKGIISKLETFSLNNIAERAYLQFDKTRYAAGDTVYFKAYVTMGERHLPSTISGVLHVDLINSNDQINQSVKLQLDSGVAWGDFVLPDSLIPGNYRIRAYTRWMRNHGGDDFFDRTIAIGSLTGTRVPESFVNLPIKTPAEKPGIQFFPEGGNLVNGIGSKVAFKSVNGGGQGINVKGVVIDAGNKEVCKFESVHLGMGCFYLKPGGGEPYRAKVTYPGGMEDMVDLPKPDTSGITLSVNNDSIPKASVTIEANPAYYQENKNKRYTLLIYSGGMATTVACKLDSPVITLDILKRRLHSGITTVTLFSPADEPLCERLLFVQNYDQLYLNINGDKTTYAKREKVNIKLTALNRAGDPSEGHFSLSVIDESKAPVDENNERTIFTDLLLTDDLKGYIERPNYYFSDTGANVGKNLDILMLTQGYRRFTWKQVLNNDSTHLAYQPEKALEISGQVKNLLGKPINNGTITLLPVKGGPLLSALTDDKGIFHFSNLAFSDTTHFVLSAVNNKGKNTTQITYFIDKPAPVNPAIKMFGAQNQLDTAMAAYLENTRKYRNELMNNGKGKGILLKEVKIRDKKLDDQYKTQSLAGAGHADQVIHAEELANGGGTLSTTLMGKIPGVHWVPTSTAGQYIPIENGGFRPMQVIIDGGPGHLDDVPFSQVETVEVLKNTTGAVYGNMDGVLVITSKSGGSKAGDIVSLGVLPIAPTGFYKAREFYSPKYENTNFNGKQHDYRSTIYWKPELVTDKNGNASFDFYNADGAGTYRVVLEGIDNKGNIGRQVYRYRVE